MHQRAYKAFVIFDLDGDAIMSIPEYTGNSYMNVGSLRSAIYKTGKSSQ
jgi:hypothetical protein